MSAPIVGREREVRYRDGEFELACHMCGDWWPITLEFWRPSNGMQRCKACWREYHRIHERNRTADEAIRLVKNYKGRIRYAERAAERRAYNRAWKAANRERVAAYNASYRARKTA
jgi:hypothetical protein